MRSVCVRPIVFSCLSVLASCAQGSGAEEHTDSEQDTGSPNVPDAANTSQSDAVAPTPSEPMVQFGSDERPWPQATFVGSEATVLDEALGSVTEQLDAGLRYLHLPIHDNDFRNRGDYGLGLEEPRDQLNTRGDNPSRENLGDWLEQVVSWSVAHPGHAPITLGIELRDDLTDNDNYDEGDLHRLNNILSHELGDKLFEPNEVSDEQWPNVDQLRGKFLVVLGGHEGTRISYREVQGVAPAIAGDPSGEMMMVHETKDFKLRYWLGHRDGMGVRWTRSGVISEWLTDPSIAVNDEGLFVIVGSSPPTQQVRSVELVVGERLPTGGVFFRDPRVLQTGSRAFVRFTDTATSNIEVLIDPGTQNATKFNIRVNRSNGTISVLKSEASADVAWDDTTIDAEDAKRLHVFVDESGVLRYETESRRRPVAPEQLAFTEYAKGEHATLQRWFRFSEDPTEMKSWIAQGLIVRARYTEEVMSLEQLPTILVSTQPFLEVLTPFLELPEAPSTPK